MKAVNHCYYTVWCIIFFYTIYNRESEETKRWTLDKLTIDSHRPTVDISWGFPAEQILLIYRL